MATAAVCVHIDTAALHERIRTELRRRECSYCKGDRVVLHAGDLSRDNGYCEIRTCPVCRDGARLGRSDTLICRMGT